MANYSDFFREFIAEYELTERSTFTREDIFDWFGHRYPDRARHFVQDQLLKKTTNYPDRVTFLPPPSAVDDLFFAEDRDFTKFTLYRKGIHPRPYYKSTERPIPPTRIANADGEVTSRDPALLGSRYRILSLLGKGGFGRTFLVEDQQSPTRKNRVVKQFRPQNDDPDLLPILRERFELEARTLESLGEANDQIPALHAYFFESGEFYLVQDWVDGRSVAKVIKEGGPLGEEEVRKFLVAILPVLEFIHEQGVIHRDISPNNVMIRARDGRPVLIDFGAVKEVASTLVDPHNYPSRTIAIGSPGYMSPEQGVGMPVYTSDLFSLGRTAVFMLTGRHPLEIYDRRTGEISWRGHTSVSEGLAKVLDKAVERHAHDRFHGAQEMLEALQGGRLSVPKRGPNRVIRIRAGGRQPTGETTLISKGTITRRNGDRQTPSPVDITEPTLLIRISKNYRQGMSAGELYDVTRGVWKVGERRKRARYAMAVYGGVVLEVYEINGWHHAGTTEYKTCPIEDMQVPGRWEFTGRVAADEVRDKYLGGSVAHYFKLGDRNPVSYINYANQE